MRIEPRPLCVSDHQDTVWCDASNSPIDGVVLGWFLPGNPHPLSRTGDDQDATQEEERLIMQAALGRFEEEIALYRIHDGNWASMMGVATYVFDGFQEGVITDTGDYYQSFVAYGSREWPEEIWGDTDDAWHLVTSYMMNPNPDCPWCGDGTGNENIRITCPLCEGQGYLAVGEYWQVAIYSHASGEEE